MDTLYAVTLMVAIAAGAIAILASLGGLIKTDTYLRPDTVVSKVLLSHRLANGALALGVVSLAISVVVHSRWGHGPGTVAPLDFSQLLSGHQAFPIAGAMLFLAMVLAFFRNRRPLSGVALLTGVLLLLPAAAMRFTNEVSWGPGDFVVAAVLLFATGSAIVLAMRLRSRAHRIGVIGLVMFALLVVWAELAVGLFH